MKLYTIAALLVLFSVSSYADKPVKFGSLCLNPVNCFVDPCQVSKCDAYPSATCASNYCGGCNADWYLNNEKIDCSASISERSVQISEKNCTTVYCFVDPCSFAKCAKHSEAVCKSNYCGGCNAWFYLGEERVECN